MQNKNTFLKAFIKNPLRTGSIVQSSPILADKMLEKIDFHSAKCIVELGSGSGIITKKILKKMRKDCVLLCFEIEKSLANKLQKIDDSRLVVICDSAERIDIYLKKHGFQKADCIVSGLPLASLPPKTSRSILKTIYAYLPSGGQYIQFQYSLAHLRQIKYLFSSVAISFVFLNFPPAFVYVCVKI
jgi:phosphatidylethanolamine/phosphatidyl-N-methylethanolamine N-methyltransferase